jgi:hypothetical protein
MEGMSRSSRVAQQKPPGAESAEEPHCQGKSTETTRSLRLKKENPVKEIVYDAVGR